MKTTIKALIVVLIGGLNILLIACDNTSDPQYSDILEEEINPEAEIQRYSRVFDGRDSLSTGFNGPTATKDNFAIVTQYLEILGGDDVGSGRVGITDPEKLDPSTLLYESREGNPIITPDGNHVTWGLFSSAEGAITVKCTKKGTHITVHLAGLISNGVYSIQNELFVPGTNELLGRVGFTGLKESSATKNFFRASASGEGHISGLVRPGAMDRGLIGDCMIDDATNDGEYIWHTVAIYQMDGTPERNADGTFVEQGGFTFHVWR